MASSREALIKVLDAIEVSALSFCSESQWADVRANVLAAGSVGEASRTAQEVLRKAARRSFGSRSEAARYAASIRWGNRGGSTGAGGGEASASVVVPRDRQISDLQFKVVDLANAASAVANEPDYPGKSERLAEIRADLESSNQELKRLRSLPAEQGESPYATEAARVQQERERMGRLAVEISQPNVELRPDQMGISKGPNQATYSPVSAEAPTAPQMKAYASKGQVGEGNRLIEYASSSGEKYLMNEGKGLGIRVNEGVDLPNPRGRSGNETQTPRADLGGDAIAKVFSNAQEQVDRLTPATTPQATLKPVGIVKQSVTTSNRPSAKPMETDLVVFDKGGKAVFVPAKSLAVAQKAYPNATLVQPESSRAISLVEGGQVKAVVMPYRMEADTKQVMRTAEAMLAAGSPAE